MKFKFFPIVFLLVGCQSGQMNVGSFDCNEKLLKEFAFHEGDLQVQSFTLSTSSPSEGAGGEIYSQNDNIRSVDLNYFGSNGKTQAHFLFLDSEDSYLLNLEDYVYDENTQPVTVTRTFAIVCDKEFRKSTNLTEERLEKIRSDLRSVLQNFHS